MAACIQNGSKPHRTADEIEHVQPETQLKTKNQSAGCFFAVQPVKSSLHPPTSKGNPMNTLGIIGGMSPESTAAYYLHINRRVNQIKGGNHSAPLLLHSVEFQHIADCQKSGDWQQAGSLLAQSARTLQNAGAQGILLATNTMHKVAAPIAASVSVPFLHILDAVA